MTLAESRIGFGAIFLTLARPNAQRVHICNQPRSNSHHLDENFVVLGNAWWLLCNSSPPIKIPQGIKLVEASGRS